MLETRDVWQDGQAGVSWFAGVHIAGWVVSGQVLNKPGCRNSGSDCTSGRHSFQDGEKREAIKKYKK